jgi:hypothetical protein
VKLNPDEAGRVLAHGIDSLDVGFQVEWLSDNFFNQLTKRKTFAAGQEVEQPTLFNVGPDAAPALMNIRPHGSDGYEWLLEGSEFSLKIGNWPTPISRPSVMASIRAEALWHHGPVAMIDRVLDLILFQTGAVIDVKPSRVDLCADVLLPRSAWQEELHHQFVTRARDIAPRLQNRKLSGFTIGSGKISARLYDKPREINVKSKKYWMFDIWGIESVEESHCIIRIEFQVRREVLKQLSIDTWQDLLDNLPQLWAYCTENWLRLVIDPSLHHTQQQLLPLWSVVAGAFEMPQGAQPLVRQKAIQADLMRQVALLIGAISSMSALLRQGRLIEPHEILDLKTHVARCASKALEKTHIDDLEFTERVKRKQAKLLRSEPNFQISSGAPPKADLDS